MLGWVVMAYFRLRYVTIAHAQRVIANDVITTPPRDFGHP